MEKEQDFIQNEKSSPFSFKKTFRNDFFKR